MKDSLGSAKHDAIHGTVGTEVANGFDDRGLLPVAVNPAFALLQAIGVPG
jgi:hypothetical protein